MAGRDLFASQQPVNQPQVTPVAQVPVDQPAPIDDNQGAGRDLLAIKDSSIPEVQDTGVLSGLWGMVTGDNKETEKSIRTPELITAPMRDVGAAVGFNLALNFDPLEIEDSIKKNIPNAIFRTDAKDNKYVEVNNKEYLINAPGLSKQDMGAAIGNVLATLGPAKLAGYAKTFFHRLGLGAVAAGATQTAIEGGQAATGGDFTPKEIVSASLFGAAGEIPAAIRVARMSDQARGFIPKVTDAQVQFARDVKQSTGVSLTPNQVTGNEFDNLTMLILKRDPNTSVEVLSRLKEQSSDVYAGVTNLMDDLATRGMSEEAASRVRTTSIEAVEAAKKTRSLETTPLYNRAWGNAAANRTNADITPTVSYLTKSLENYVEGGTVHDSVTNMLSLVKKAGEPATTGTNIQKLHNLKREIFAETNKLKKDGTFTSDIDTIFKGAYDRVKSSIESVSPDYEIANSTYRNMSPEVDLIADSVVGAVAQVDPKKLAGVRKLLFNWQENNANVGAIRQAKRIIQGTDPEAWTSILRNKLDQDLAEIGISTVKDAQDTTQNILQRLYKKTFSGKDKELMMQSLDGQQRANFEALSLAIDKARNIPGQSATKQLQEMEDALSGKVGVPNFIRAMLTGGSEVLTGSMFGSNVRARNFKTLSKILLDPEWTENISTIRKMGLSTHKGGAAFAQLFREALDKEETK